MVTILCVLKSGGIYNEDWVEKLWSGVSRHMPTNFRFVCMSDVETGFDRIPLKHDWPGWWSKVEMFAPGIISGPTLYLDLDTIITGTLEPFLDLPYEFAMLDNFNEDEMVGSGVMWFKDKAPEGVYERFIQGPDRIMDHYQNVKHGAYRGDQAFIFDILDRNVDRISSPSLRHYKKHCRGGLPDGTSIVCFGGRPRPTEVNAPWMRRHWS